MPPESASRAFSVFTRWRDARTLLRIRGELSPVVFDVEGRIIRADAPMVGVSIEDRGTVEILLAGEWRFSLSKPELSRGNFQEAIGKSSSDSKRYEFGEAVVAHKPDGSRCTVMFMEILGPVIESKR